MKINIPPTTTTKTIIIIIIIVVDDDELFFTGSGFAGVFESGNDNGAFCRAGCLLFEPNNFEKIPGSFDGSIDVSPEGDDSLEFVSDCCGLLDGDVPGTVVAGRVFYGSPSGFGDALLPEHELFIFGASAISCAETLFSFKIFWHIVALHVSNGA